MTWLQKYSRVTSSGRFLPVVDGLRCVAILSVMLYHLEDYLAHKATSWDAAAVGSSVVHRFLHAGNVGVPLFFAISGFILALPFCEALLGDRPGKLPDLRRYYLRRVTRLEPPYLINLALVFCLLVVAKGLAAGELWPHLAASMGYVHNQIYGRLSEVNGVAWSLEIEVQFYIVAPFLARWLFSTPRSVRRAVMLGAIALAMAAKMALGPYPPRVTLSLPGTIEHFVVGILLADLFVTEWRARPRRSYAWDLVTVAVWPAIFGIQRVPQLAACLPVLTLAAYAAAFRGRGTHRVLTWAPAVVVGGMCYTIYLYHFFIISFVGRFTLPLTEARGYLPSVAVQSLIIVPATIAVCAVLFRLFERPFMAWRPWQKVASQPSAAPLVGTGV